MKKIFTLITAIFCFGNTYCQTAEEFYKRGYEKTDLKDFVGAIIDFTKAIELKSDYVSAYNDRGIAKIQLEDYRGANLDFQKAYIFNLDKTVSDAQICYNIGYVMAKLQDYINAIGILNEAIKYNSKYIDAYLLIGLAKLKLSQKENACLDFSKAGELGSEEAYKMIKKYCN